MNYKAFIQDNFQIINKDGKLVDFILNPIQAQYLEVDSSGKDIICKARQQGFSSIIEARFTVDFITKRNSQSVVIADNSENAKARLDQVKGFIKSYEERNHIKVPLKYNSRQELVNEAMNSKYFIGTGENADVGRSRTLNNLHISEGAFIRNFRRLLSGILQALVPDGYAVLESTSNGFNEWKSYYDESQLGETGFKALFYKASDFYGPEFLAIKKRELGIYFVQEYPETSLESFMNSGQAFFAQSALEWHLSNVREPMADDDPRVIY